MKLTRKEALWVGGVTPLAALMILLSFLLFKQSEEAAERQKHTFNVLSVAQAFMSDLKDAETGQRGYLITGDEAYLEPYLAVRHKIADRLAQLRQLSRDNASSQHSLEVIVPLVDERLALLQQGIVLRREMRAEDALKIVRSGQGKQLMDSIRSEMSVFVSLENDSLAQREAVFVVTFRNLKILMTAASAFIGILSLVSAFVVYRETRLRFQTQTESEKAVAAARESMQDRENILLVARNELDMLQAASSERENALSVRINELDALQKKLNNNEKIQLAARKGLDELQESLQLKENTLLHASRETDALQAALRDKENMLLLAGKELETLQDVFGDRERSLEAKLNELAAREKMLLDQEDTLLAYRRKLDALQAALLEKETTLLTVRQESEGIRAALADKEHALVAIRNELDAVQGELCARENAQYDLRKELERVQAKLCGKDNAPMFVTDANGSEDENTEGNHEAHLNELPDEYVAWEVTAGQPVTIEKNLASVFAAMEQAALSDGMSYDVPTAEPALTDVFKRLGKA